MIALLKRFKIVLIPLLLVYIYLGLILIPKTKYSLTVEGGLTNVNKSFVFEDDENTTLKNNFSTIYVYDYHRVTPFQRWMLDKSTRYEVTPKQERDIDLTSYERNLMGQISKQSGYEESLIIAYKYAKLINDEKGIDHNVNIDYEFESLIVYYKIHELKLGDHIIAINDEPFAKDIIGREAQLKLYYTEVPYTLKVLRNDEEITINVTEKITISTFPKYNIIETRPKISKTAPKSSSGGSSGGLLQALALYATLINADLKNVKISGTGAITLANDEKVGVVQPIGGVVQKFYTARSNKVDYMFVPDEYLKDIDDLPTRYFSLEEHLEIEKLKKKTKMKVFYVGSFKEAVEVFNEEILK